MKNAAPAMSHTRVRQWELCPMAYKLKYIDRAPAQLVPHMDLGIVVHRALELLVKDAIAATPHQSLTAAAGEAALMAAWATERATGSKAYADAAAMVQRFVSDETNLDLDAVLGIEQPFSINVGGTMLNGFMDRIDRIDDETIEIVDYKTGVQIPSADDLATNLQLTLYQHAAQALWPWAKQVTLTLHMMRHGVKLRTTRTQEQVAEALQYVQATASQIATAAGSGSYPCALSAACGTCLYRLSCPAYRALLQAPEGVEDAAPRSLEAAASQRDRMSALAKAAEGRKRELDVILRKALDEQGDIEAAGRHYFLRNTARRTYPVVNTIARLSAASGEPALGLAERLTSISNGSLTAFVKSLADKMSKTEAEMLRVELDATADCNYVPQIWSKPV